MTCDETDKLSRSGKLRCLLWEAIVTLTIYTIVAVLLVAILALVGTEFLHYDRDGTVAFLLWSGVGIGTGTTVSAMSMVVFFIAKAREFRRGVATR